MNEQARELANRSAIERIADTVPVLRELVTAREGLGLAEGELGHAGPPFEGGEMPPPVVLNALAGAVVHEGWAGDVVSARRMILDGEIRLRPNHSLGTVSPMAGVVRPSQMLFRIEDDQGAKATYATLAEKGRRVLRFGFYDETVAEGLRFVEQDIARAIAASLPRGGLPILPLVAEGVKLGDDVHQRNVGGMLAFLAALPDMSYSAREWLSDHPQHFLNYAMAAAKLCLDNARGIAGSSIVTAISRNGIVCGIQVAGAGDTWFRAPADSPDGRFVAPYTAGDAHPDLGDSAIMESFGLGGCIAHCSPDIAGAMGRSWAESIEAGQDMRSLFAAANPHIGSPLAGDAGIGLGLDAERAAAAPGGVRIHTGIAHISAEAGWIGIGVAHAPRACFAAAANSLDNVSGQTTSTFNSKSTDRRL